MILDKIQNIDLYKKVHPCINIALTYIKNTNFLNLDFGKFEIEGDRVFAIYKEYETTPVGDKLSESHLKYIDVQYVVEGAEEMGVTTRTDQESTTSYDDEQDYMLFNEPYDVITVKAGMFAIFFPDDIHMPEITTNKPSNVKKIVVKVKI